MIPVGFLFFFAIAGFVVSFMIACGFTNEAGKGTPGAEWWRNFWCIMTVHCLLMIIGVAEVCGTSPHHEVSGMTLLVMPFSPSEFSCVSTTPSAFAKVRPARSSLMPSSASRAQTARPFFTKSFHCNGRTRAEQTPAQHHRVHGDPRLSRPLCRPRAVHVPNPRPLRT